MQQPAQSGFDRSFNTQPPEGGWCSLCEPSYRLSSFNTQPPEGGWQHALEHNEYLKSFNTQPPEGGWLRSGGIFPAQEVSTHSRPKAAGRD